MTIANTIFTVLKINTCMTFNRVVFYFKKLPLIGKLLPDSVYSFRDIKLFVWVISTLGKAFYKLFCVAFYLLCMVFPLAFISPIYDGNGELRFAVLANALCWLSLLAGSAQKRTFLDSTQEKYVFIKLMRIPAKQYLLSEFWMAHLGNGLAFFALLPLICVLAGMPVIWGFLFPFYLITAHCLADVIDLVLYARWKSYEKALKILNPAVTLVGIVGAYLPLAFVRGDNKAGERMITAMNGFLSLPVALAFLLLFCLLAVAVTRYPHYKRLFTETFQTESVLNTANQKQQDVNFLDVQLKADDLTKNTEQVSAVSQKTGFSYLNALFFARHRRLFVKPLRTQILAVAALTVGVVLLMLFLPETAETIGGFFAGSVALPIFVFVMYCTSLGGKICKAMFVNCDISLLRYPFYRKKSVLLDTFRIRLFSVVKLNLWFALAVCAGSGIIVAVSGVSWGWLDFVLFCLSILLLSVFFSVHHLFLYYVFQPYTTDLGIQNSFFKIINSVVYVLCYLCLQLDAVPKSFVWIVLTATTVYIVTALLLVYLFAPKTFRVK